jgi:hypothetical protein
VVPCALFGAGSADQDGSRAAYAWRRTLGWQRLADVACSFAAALYLSSLNRTSRADGPVWLLRRWQTSIFYPAHNYCLIQCFWRLTEHGVLQLSYAGGCSDSLWPLAFPYTTAKPASDGCRASPKRHLFSGDFCAAWRNTPACQDL